ncbi:acyltransferase [Lichenicoccus sp.]|uniref:acyltransferase n=1 Tax=Lichenicoccus sp. TaxID=2781899 RepID=UPI003D10D84C
MTTPASPVFSYRISRIRRLARFLRSSVDPRAYLHFLRIVNFYNHSHVTPRRRITAGQACSISPDVNFMHGERIFLGDRVSLASRCFLWAGPAQGTIILEDDVLLGPEVLITAATYRYNEGTPVTKQPMKESNIHIARDVWIGCRAMIMPGVTLGAGCVVGAGAIVTKSFPAGSVLVGAPARLVRTRKYPPDPTIDLSGCPQV